MKLLTKEITKKVPNIYGQEEVEDKIVYAKFFDCCSNWTWYLMEYDPETGMCFGLVEGFEKEYGYFNIHELAQVKNRLGLGIERDLHFDACKLSELTN